MVDLHTGDEYPIKVKKRKSFVFSQLRMVRIEGLDLAMRVM